MTVSQFPASTQPATAREGTPNKSQIRSTSAGTFFSKPSSTLQIFGYQKEQLQKQGEEQNFMKKINNIKKFPLKQGVGKRNLKKQKVQNKDIMSPPLPEDDLLKVQDYLN